MRPHRLRQSPLLISDLPQLALEGLLQAALALRDAAQTTAVRFRKRINSTIRQLQLELEQPLENLLTYDFVQITETNFVEFVANDSAVQPVQLNPSQLNASPRLVSLIAGDSFQHM